MNNNKIIENEGKSKLRNKRVILALLVLFCVGMIGGGFAYFTTTTTFDNMFQVKTYNTKFEEKFESPDNWAPGSTISKEIIAINVGSVDVAVRVSYKEEWVSASGKKLDGFQDGNKAAILNLSNTADWTKYGDYYVYNKKLVPNQKTNSFLESVTFNKDIENDSICETIDGIKNCTSTGNGYDGATYTLTLTIETIQFDVAEKQWNLEGFNWTN